MAVLTARKRSLVSIKHFFISWINEEVASLIFSLIICDDTVITYIFYSIASHSLGKNAASIHKHFFNYVLKIFGSSSPGMLFPCWWDAAAMTRTGTHLHNSLQNVQAAFQLSLWCSWSRITAFLCEEGGEGRILLFWEIYGKCKDWFLWYFKCSWIQLGIKPSVTSWCLCSPNCHLVLLSLPLNALCTIISENLGRKQICSYFVPSFCVRRSLYFVWLL